MDKERRQQRFMLKAVIMSYILVPFASLAIYAFFKGGGSISDIEEILPLLLCMIVGSGVIVYYHYDSYLKTREPRLKKPRPGREKSPDRMKFYEENQRILTELKEQTQDIYSFDKNSRDS